MSVCLCRFATERDDDLAMESSFAQQQFEEQRRFVQGVHHSSQTSPAFRCKNWSRRRPENEICAMFYFCSFRGNTYSLWEHDGPIVMNYLTNYVSIYKLSHSLLCVNGFLD